MAGTWFAKLGQPVMERQLAKGNLILSPECRAGSVQAFTDSGQIRLGGPVGLGFQVAGEIKDVKAGKCQA